MDLSVSVSQRILDLDTDKRIDRPTDVMKQNTMHIEGREDGSEPILYTVQ
jgi:hypothetical protein